MMIRRVKHPWRRWEWEFYHSGYGWAGGYTLTKRGAERKLDRAIVYFTRGDF